MSSTDTVTSDHRPQLTFDCPYDLIQELKDYLPWGMRSTIFVMFTKDLIEILKSQSPEQREFFFGLVISEHIKLKDYIKILKEAKNARP